MRLAWTTDIHLNFVKAAVRQRFLESLSEAADAVAISGDIAESSDVETYLQEIQDHLQRPIFFVLGNHDFYRGSILKTRSAVTRLAAQAPHLSYMSVTTAVALSPQTAIIGHDGWADARLGDFAGSNVMLNDYRLIEELRGWRREVIHPRESLRRVLQELGDEAAQHFQRALAEVTGRYKHVIAITHVPPFREATWHQQQISDDNWLPHFSCKAVGDALLHAAESNPGCQMLVLCGHTHGGGEAQILDNLRVLTGEAEYGRPEVQRILQIA